MNLRRATTDDIPRIQEMCEREPQAPRWTEASYRALIRTQDERATRAVVAESDGGLLGFYAARCVAPAEWELENIVVMAERRRSGVGTALMDDLLQAAKSSKIYLEVRASNEAARSLYERFGFAEQGRRRLYYRDPEEDAVLYMRQC